MKSDPEEREDDSDIRRMTEKEFTSILREEGLPIADIVYLWKTRPTDYLSERKLRLTARSF
jgi:hypothetical protein